MLRFLSLAFLMFAAFAQGQADPCAQTKWSIVERDSVNTPLFSSDLGNQHKDLFSTVKALALDGKIAIYKETTENDYFATTWEEIPDLQVETDAFGEDTLFTVEKESYFEHLVYSNMPLLDERGEPMWIDQPDGSQVLMYPPPTHNVISIDSITEIRIREELSYSAIADESYYDVTGLSFVYPSLKSYNIFWVSVFELKEALKKTEPKPLWYDFLLSQKFEGYTYMRKPCR